MASETSSIVNKAQKAAITTAVVLLTIYIARRVPVVGPVVNKALNG